jgi:hypothetical protein
MSLEEITEVPAPVVSRATPRPKRLDRVALGVAGVVAVYLMTLTVVASGIFDGKPRGPSGDGKLENSAHDGKHLDLSYITEDFNGAVIVHPRRLLEASMLAPLPLDKLSAGTELLLGVDPRKVEQLIFLVEPFPDGIKPYSDAGMAGILRFTDKVRGKELLPKLLRGASEATFNDKTIWKSKTFKVGIAPAMPVAGYVADERTLLVAPEPILAKMLLAQKAKSPLIDTLAKADLQNDVLVAFTFESKKKDLDGKTLRQKASALVSSFKEMLPPGLAAAATVPDRLKTATLAVDLRGKTLVELTLEADSSASAKVLHDLLEQGLVFGKGFMATEGKDMLGRLGPTGKAAGKTVDEIMDGLTLSQDGADVRLKVPKPNGLSQLIEQLAPMVNQAFEERPRK